MKVQFPIPISKSWKLKESIVYGPFPTRRKGMALGINLLAYGEKFCSFDCLYCQCGWTRQFDPQKALPEHYLSLKEIHESLENRFSEIAELKQQVDSIVLSGNGEPTLHPFFDQSVDSLIEARNRHFPDLKIQCLTAGTELNREEVVRALNKIDRPTFKLDAALPELHQKIDRSLVPFSLAEFEKNLKNIENVYLQTCFFDGKINNIFPEALEAWYLMVERICPVEVEIYSIHREPAAKKLLGVPFEKLKNIADELESRIGISTQVV